MKFKIPVEWSMYGTVEVEARTVKEAVKKAEDYFYNSATPLPEGNYIEDSLIINDDEETIKMLSK